MSDGVEINLGCGCLPLALFIAVVWALAFGVTCNNTHYDPGCNTNEGLVVKETKK